MACLRLDKVLVNTMTPMMTRKAGTKAFLAMEGPDKGPKLHLRDVSGRYDRR